ncbi:MAG: hypothetical protein J3Q66DRAFT_353179 [Benniella sp.]|nr:MAG: hypothetical protein J3Q66DRAFT_353179 [Benniella sp.]
MVADTPSSLFCTLCAGAGQLHQRRRSNGRKSLSLSFFLLTTLLLLFTLSLCPTIQAQPPGRPYIYTSRYNAGSTLANNTLFVISGTLSLAPPFKATTETLAIPLDRAFSTSAIPWKALAEGPPVLDARVATSVDQDHLVVVGVDRAGQLVIVYDILSDTWSDLPPTAVSNQLLKAPRRGVGVSIDKSTGQMVLYGGMMEVQTPTNKTYSLVGEIDILDTRPTFDKWSWSAAIESNRPPPPGVTQPIVLYLPTLQQTLIMGGCDGLNATDGSITRCASFSSGYLVNSMVTASKEPSVPIKYVSMDGPIPSPRLSPCTVVLSNGDVFMYGGVSLTGALSDAWVLSTKSWIWASRTIKNMPVSGRAGATCQSIADQIILVGGFDFTLGVPRQFSQPQVAIINTTSWEWGSNFVPAHNPDSDGMSSGLVIGITVGGTVILCVIFFLIGRLLWERQQLKQQRLLGKKGYNASRMSQSTQPLMESGEFYTQDTDLGSTAMVSFTSSPHRYHSDFYQQQQQQQQRGRSDSHTSHDSGLDGSRILASQRTGERERKPLLIIPYPPTDLASDTTSPRTPSEAAVKSHLVGHTKRDSHGTLASTSSSSIEKGDQLPQTLADIQHGHYVKTLQHQKMYERRRQELEQQQQFRLNRSQTQHTVGGHQHDGMDGGNNLDLATAVIALKEVDVGEEPFRGGWYDDNDGTVLLSSHLDQSQA